MPRKRPEFRRTLQAEPLESRQMLHGGVYPEVTLHTNLGDITIELYADDAPRTVENFLSYVRDGAYVHSVFHSLARDEQVPAESVLQGGGFTSDPAEVCTLPCSVDDVTPEQFAEVPADAPIANEFGRSNTRGTVAMAKVAGDADSATSQFFVNLRDNNSDFDVQDGGFTVFAGVTDMTVVDEIATLDTIDLSTAFPSDSRLQSITDAPYALDETAGTVSVVRMEAITGKGLLHGTLFLDNDSDGVAEAGEGGLAERTVYLDANDNGALDDDETTTTANQRGEYHFLVDPGEHVVRQIVPADYDASGSPASYAVTIAVGGDIHNLDFGSRYTGLSWHNDVVATDVDGINGTTPIDALLVINEFDERDFSDSRDGTLPELTTPLAPPRFLDVKRNNIVEPLDALLVINELPSSAPAAASSTSAGNTSSGWRRDWLTSASATVAALPEDVNVTNENPADAPPRSTDDRPADALRTAGRSAKPTRHAADRTVSPRTHQTSVSPYRAASRRWEDRADGFFETLHGTL